MHVGRTFRRCVDLDSLRDTRPGTGVCLCVLPTLGFSSVEFVHARCVLPVCAALPGSPLAPGAHQALVAVILA